MTGYCNQTWKECVFVIGRKIVGKSQTNRSQCRPRSHSCYKALLSLTVCCFLIPSPPIQACQHRRRRQVDDIVVSALVLKQPPPHPCLQKPKSAERPRDDIKELYDSRFEMVAEVVCRVRHSSVVDAGCHDVDSNMVRGPSKRQSSQRSHDF